MCCIKDLVLCYLHKKEAFILKFTKSSKNIN